MYINYTMHLGNGGKKYIIIATLSVLGGKKRIVPYLCPLV